MLSSAPRCHAWFHVCGQALRVVDGNLPATGPGPLRDKSTATTQDNTNKRLRIMIHLLSRRHERVTHLMMEATPPRDL
jgi:hypothetical protein